MKNTVLKAVVTAIFVLLFMPGSKAGEFNRAWLSPNSSIVLDAYEYTPIEWSKINNNKRLVGFINKASDGLSPTSRCRKDELCRVKWRRYAATKELYHTRRILAKTLGLKWGAYHLARPGNPIQQAQHFLEFANPSEDDLIALDIEHNDPEKWMSLEDAETFARFIKIKTGRYPVLYTNHSTSKFIAANRDRLKLLSRLNLWYARYKPNMKGAFPMGNWDSYTLWQFSSMVNCSKRSCPWRINGAGPWIDVNVVAMSPARLKKEWPFAKLSAKPAPDNLPSSDALISGRIDPMTVASRTPAPTFVTTSELTVPKWRPGAVIVKRENPSDDNQMVYDMAQIFESNLGMSLQKLQESPRIETVVVAEARRQQQSNDKQLAYEVAHYFESNLGMPLFNSLNTPPKSVVIEAEIMRSPNDYPGAL